MAAAIFNGKDCQSTTVCVTGATGYLASSLVKSLLDKGYTVHATVRDPENKAKVGHLLNIPEAGEKLKLFRADLLEEGSFEAAFDGCDGVFHVASPVDFAPKDAEAYAVAKTLAEQEALQYGKDAGLDVVTISPALVLGSAITPNVPFSVEFTLSLLTGSQQSIETLKIVQMTYGSVPLVHVEDVSNAHIFLMENPGAHGRYICCAVNICIPQLAEHLSKRYPQYNVPTQFEDVPRIPKVNLSSKKLVESGFSFNFGIDEIYDDAVEYMKAKGLLV